MNASTLWHRLLRSVGLTKSAPPKRDSEIIKSLMSPDAKTRLTIYALENGFFSFAESYETTEDLREFGMGVETYWSPGWESGLYESADKAEKNAYAMIPWLQANSS